MGRSRPIHQVILSIIASWWPVQSNDTSSVWGRDGNMGTQTDMVAGSVVEELLWLKTPPSSKSLFYQSSWILNYMPSVTSRPVPKCNIFTPRPCLYLKIRLHPQFRRYKNGENKPKEIKAARWILQLQCSVMAVTCKIMCKEGELKKDVIYLYNVYV